MPDQHLLAAAYALDALDEVERRRFERHLAACALCLVEVREFAEAAAALADRVAEPAPGALRERVMADVTRTRQLPSRTSRSVRGPSWHRALAGAAAAVLMAGGAALGTVAYQEHQSAEQARDLAEGISRVLTSADRADANQPVTGGGRATAVVADGEAVLSTTGLADAPQGREYQMWVIGADGVIRSGGKLDLTRGEGTELVTGVPDDATLALTIEPEGGSQQPTMDPLVALKVT